MKTQWQKDGWKHDPEYLQTIQDKLNEQNDYLTSLEEIDEILHIGVAAERERIKEAVRQQISEKYSDFILELIDSL